MQLHEMLYYLNEALGLEEAQPIYINLSQAAAETEWVTNQYPRFLLDFHIPGHRATVNDLLLQTSKLVRNKVEKNLENSTQRKVNRGKDLIGSNLRGADLRGANLTGCILLTQAQVNSAHGDSYTQLPPSINMPDHWKT
jgi:uncharacterized protein YjbI with pentapeptide repeats